MTDIQAYRVGDIPLVRVRGSVTAKTGAELASDVMTAICYIFDEEDRKPLSLPSPRLMRS